MTLLRVATYNIHKGVQGFGPTRRLEIHNLGHAVEQLDADIVCLQEVRKLHRREERYFTRWPELPQAEFLCPEGYAAVYQTNATTRHGEHGNALLSRWPVVSHGHEDMSDHRFEQRGLLHVTVRVARHEVHVMGQFGLRDHVEEKARTYPSRLPLTQLDYVYSRGLRPVGVEIPRGRVWGQMSDHLPLIASFRM